MADKLTAVKIKYDGGTYSDQIPISAKAENVICDNSNVLSDVLDTIDTSIQELQNRIAVPSYGLNDHNKVLSVNNTGNDITWSQVDIEGLPSYGQSDHDKILSVNSTGDGVAWSNIDIEGLPSYGQSDHNKVLTVNNTGDDVVWSNTKALPEASSQYSGQVLMVRYVSGVCGRPGEYKAVWGPNTVRDPAVTNVLTAAYSNNEWDLKWGQGLPTYCGNTQGWTSPDEGKVLTIVETSSGYQWGARWQYPPKGVPNYDQSQAGKVLGIVMDGDEASLSWVAGGGGGGGSDLIPVPQMSPYGGCFDTGKTLIVNDSGQYELQKLIPSSSASDVGKFLILDGSNGNSLYKFSDFVMPECNSSFSENLVLTITDYCATTNTPTVEWKSVSQLINS